MFCIQWIVPFRLQNNFAFSTFDLRSQVTRRANIIRQGLAMALKVWGQIAHRAHNPMSRLHLRNTGEATWTGDLVYAHCIEGHVY